jgi:SAM-dependent methyltransferase
MGLKQRALDGMHRLHFELIHGRRITGLAACFAEVLPRDATVLDVGSGDGYLATEIMKRRPDLTISGVDIIPRREAFIPVDLFDGHRLPYDDGSYDVVMFSDVLHHTTNQRELLTEAGRVARRSVVVKDHLNERRVDEWCLRVMDWFGNRHNDVPLPYDYWPDDRWRSELDRAGIEVDHVDQRIRVYPQPLQAVFGRGLHVVISGRPRVTPAV